MPAAPASPFLNRVRQQLDALHPAERQLAEFVLDFPGDMASYAASELARLSGVSNATVSRFIKRLGYRDYEQARLQVREERSTGSPLYLASRTPSMDAPFEAHLARSQDNLARTLARLDPATTDAVARACLAARRVWVLGFRTSQSFAAYFRWQLFQIKESVQLVPAPGDTLGQYLASIEPDDVVVVFALRRRPTHLRHLLQALINRGAPVLYVSDEAGSPRQGLTWCIHCVCDSALPLDDHSAVTSVSHLLLSRMLELAGPAERARLSAIEAEHSGLQEL